MKSNSNLHTTRLLLQLAHHKIECSILLLLLLISIGEYNASKYGNALYIKEKEIKLGVKICKCVDVGLTDADGVFFICDNADFYVNNNILLHINKFYGYGLSCDSLYALVEIGDNDLISLAFGNAKDVENKSPIITSCKKSDVKMGRCKECSIACLLLEVYCISIINRCSYVNIYDDCQFCK